MKSIRNLAEEQFRIALERERQERRWVAGQTLLQYIPRESLLDVDADLLQSSSLPSTAEFKPDKQWKSRLKTHIENNKPCSALSSASGLDEEYSATMKSIGNLVEEQFGIALERERRRRWVAGQILNWGWPEISFVPSQPIAEASELPSNRPVPHGIGKGSVSSGVGSYKHLFSLHTDIEHTKPSPTIDNVSRSAILARDAQHRIRRESLDTSGLFTRPVVPEI
ncbi:uncharacterized protein EDB91DRAFT_1250451 [Suillus paluster]|uniref:uncharacterized protein n=1 Tax=Suillus paluster TaxID=48578 RepID=UPI001B85F28E|nr:uncharacterized protein EDB91DRAFT_1250451 [Suillus paluster]KAG1735616.1 hypothetical protein EDB91DRAFT_1250451 [Suillus paluster]